MQGSTGQSGNQNGQKQGGLSWTQSPSSGSVSSNINNNAGGAKPISQVQPSVNKPANNMPSKAPSMPSNSIAKKNDGKQGGGARTAGIFIAGVIVGLIIGWGWFSLGRDTGKVATGDNGAVTSSSSESGTSANTSGTVAGTSKTDTSASGSSGAVTAGSSGVNAVSVDSQSAGLSVRVSSLSVSAPTWVVIFDNVNGNPGNALGAKMFFPGDTSGTVDLLRGTIAGKSYFVGEYVDDGDHKFSKQSDSQVKTVAGVPLMVQFNVR